MVDNKTVRYRKYVIKHLASTPELSSYIQTAWILLTREDPGIVWDFMILLQSSAFDGFKGKHGETFAIDNHNHDPPVFTRVKDFQWLEADFQRRLPIALWIFDHSIAIQDPKSRFAHLLKKQKHIFRAKLPGIIRQKYLEFRTERHNLRQTVSKERGMATQLIKTTVAKLAMEISVLATGRPYPFKKWLPTVTAQEGGHGGTIVNLAKHFLQATDQRMIIRLSDELVAEVIQVIRETGICSEDFLVRWWLHLA